MATAYLVGFIDTQIEPPVVKRVVKVQEGVVRMGSSARVARLCRIFDGDVDISGKT